MDDSDVVSFGPSGNDRENAEETLHEDVHAEGSDINVDKGGLEASQAEMKRAMEECLFEFSNRMENMFKCFEDKMEPNRGMPVLGRRRPESTPRLSKHESRENINNSHTCGVPIVSPNKTVHERNEVNCKIKPQIYNGSDDLEEYLTQYTLVSELNGWKESTKALFLASSLSGGARALLNEMSDNERHNYQSLVEALRNRFGSENRSEVFRAELQTRVRMKNETLPELAQAIKQLTRRAYPGTSPVVKDTLALDYFIDAIPETEIRLRLREVGPKSISEAENIAVRLEALRIADRQKGRSVRSAEVDVTSINLANNIDEIKNSVKSLRSEVNAMKNDKKYENQNRPGPPIRRPWNNRGGFNDRPNGSFRRAENWQESISRVGARPPPRGPIQ